MKIETEFDVGDLTKLKYATLSEDFKFVFHNVFLISDVETRTCYAGTQTNYQGRFYIMRKEKDRDNKITWEINLAKIGNDARPSIQIFREDELLKVDKEVTDIFKNYK
ncbi:hypothetical protein ES703_18801 [subsurface metagenome]